MRKKAAPPYHKKKKPNKRFKNELRYMEKLPELKAYDLTQVLAGILPAGNTGGNVQSNIFVPTLGTDFTNRIGRKCQITSWQIRGHFVWTDSATHVEDQVLLCWAMVLDRQPNGAAAPTMNDIWSGTNGTTQATGTSMVNLNNRKRFKILHFEQKCTPYVVSASQALTTVNQLDQSVSYSIEAYIDFRKLKIGPTIFDAANAGAYSDMTENALSLWFWVGTPAGTVSNGLIDCNYTSRVRFYDC